MKTEPRKSSRRLAAKYTASEREQLIEEYGRSGLSKKAFCENRGLNLATFYGWTKGKATPAPRFAKVEMTVPGPAPIEIDNNLVENAIRPTALGKKDYLFFGAPDAGERAAIF